MNRTSNFLESNMIVSFHIMGLHTRIKWEHVRPFLLASYDIDMVYWQKYDGKYHHDCKVQVQNKLQKGSPENSRKKQAYTLTKVFPSMLCLSFLLKPHTISIRSILFVFLTEEQKHYMPVKEHSQDWILLKHVFLVYSTVSETKQILLNRTKLSQCCHSGIVRCIPSTLYSS